MALHKRLFFLLLVLLPTQLGYHMWPPWSLVLGRRIDYLSPTLYATDILIGGVILFWIIENVLRNKDRRKQLVRTLIRNTKYVIPFLSFVGLNVWLAASRPAAIYAWVKVLEYVLLGWYVIRTKPKLFTVAMGLLVAVFYTSIIAITQFTVQHSVGGPLWWLGERTFSQFTPGIARLSWCMFPDVGCQELLRGYGTFPHPNVLGGYIATLLPLAIWQITNHKSQITKIFCWATIVLGTIALVLTFSRSAWVVGALGVGITYYVLWFNKLLSHRATVIRNTIAIMLLVLLGGLAIIIFPANTDETFVRRAELNQAAMTMWKRSPLVGVGLGNFIVRLPDTHVSRQGNFLQPVHNVYLLVLSETGIIGFIVFLVFIIKRLWVMVYRIWDKTNTNRYTIYEIPFTMLLLLGLVDHYPLTLQQGQLLFTLFAAMSLVSTSR